MRAVVVRSFGGPDALQLVDVTAPEPGVRQVRIRVEAAAVNPVDVATRVGALFANGLVGARDVHGIGWDVAGVVESIGTEVSTFAPGDRVIGLCDRLGLPLGAYADSIVLNDDAVARAPTRATAAEAATLPLNGLTALQALELASLPAGSTLLVTGAAGGVGGYAVQLAVHRGLRVVAVAGADDEALVRELGAALFVPRSALLGPAVRELAPGGVDGAVDAASVGVDALDAVTGGGSFVAVLGGAPRPLRGIRVSNVWIRADGEPLTQLSRLVDDGAIALRVADTLPLADAAVAHERLGKGGVRGRIVLVP